jgi:hypothetical protein
MRRQYAIPSSLLPRPRPLALLAAAWGGIVPVALAQGDFVECTRRLYSTPSDPASIGSEVSIVSVPDVSGDGYPELLVGSPEDRLFPHSQLAGHVHLLDGRTGVERFRIVGIANDRLGRSVSPAGDFDQDGIGDLLVGAPGIGAARVYSGIDGTLLLEVTGAMRAFGRSVAGVGDIDADGVPDLAVAELEISSTVAPDGRVRLVSGADGSEIGVLVGDPYFGYDIASLGNLNSDGRSELAVLGGGRVSVIDLATLAEVAAVVGGQDGSFQRISFLGVPSPSRFLSYPSVPTILITGVQDVIPPIGVADHGIAFLAGATTGTILRTYRGRYGEFFGPGVPLASDQDDDRVRDFALLGSGPASGAGGSAWMVPAWIGVLSTSTGALLRAVTDTTGHPEALQGLVALPDLDGDGLDELAVARHVARDLLVVGRSVSLISSKAPIEAFGQAVAGSAGIEPRISVDACPRLGTSIRVETERVLGRARGAIVLGLARIDQPLGAGILYPRPDLRFWHRATGAQGVPGAGDASQPIGIPFDVQLVGVQVFVQAAYLDRGAAGGVAFTRALELELY